MKNKEFIKSWCEDLESGKYKQGKVRLRKKEKGKITYCCLGVACNKIDKKQWIKDPFNGDFYEYLNNTMWMPEFIRKQIGITEKQQNKLAEMNDSGKTFSEISSWIRKNILKEGK